MWLRNVWKRVCASLLLALFSACVLGGHNWKEEQRRFKEQPQLLGQLALFLGTRAFSRHDADLFKDISPQALLLFLQARGVLIRFLTNKDLEQLSDHPELCQHLHPFMDKIDVYAYAGISFACLKEMLSPLLTDADSLAFLSKKISRIFLSVLPSRVFEEGGLELLRILTTKASYLSTSQLRLILKREDGCENIRVEWLLSLSAEKWRVFTPSCIAAMAGWEGLVPPPAFLRRLPAEAFSFMDRFLHDEAYGQLSREQVINFSTALSPSSSYRCRTLKVHLLNRDAMAGVNGACFKGFLRAEHTDGEAPQIGRKLLYAGEQILSDLEPEDASVIHSEDWANLNAAQLQNMPATACAGITGSTEIWTNSFFVPSPRCFAALPSSTQLEWLKEWWRLPGGILAHLTRSMVEEWPERLNTLVQFGLPAEMITKMGRLVSDTSEHPCQLLRSRKSLLLKNDRLVGYMGEGCVQVILSNLSDKLEEEDYRRLGQHVFVMGSGPSEYLLQTVRPLTLELASHNNNFCARLTAKQLAMIPPSVRSSFKSRCIIEWTFLSEQGPQEIALLGVRAFSRFDLAALLRLTSPLLLTATQLHNLADDYEYLPPAEHPINAFKAEHIAKLTEEHASMLKAVHLAAMFDEHYGGLLRGHIAASPPPAWRLVRSGQLVHVRPEAFAGFTAAHFEHLGADLDETRQHQYVITRAQRDALTAEARAAMEKHIRVTSAAVRMPMPTTILGITTAISIVALLAI